MTSETDIIFGGGPNEDDDGEVITPGDPEVINLFGDPPVARDDLITRSVLDLGYGYYLDPVTGDRHYGYFVGGYVFPDNGEGADFDPEGDLFRVYAVNGGSPTFSLTDADRGGEVVLAPWGGFLYRSDTNFTSLAQGQTFIDTFSYAISDGGGGSVGLVTLVIEGVNDAPVGERHVAETDIRTPIALLDLMDHVSDPDDGAVVSFVSLVATGEIRYDETAYEIVDGGIYFDPRAANQWLGVGRTITQDFVLTFQDEYGATGTSIVSIKVNGINQPAQAVMDEYFYTVGDYEYDYEGVKFVYLDVLANDIDPNRIGIWPDGPRETLYVEDVDSSGVQGLVLWASDGIGYYADEEFLSLGAGQSVTQTLTYAMSDFWGAPSTATVLIHVTGVNDAPVAVDDAYAISADSGPRLLMIAGNDHDPDDGDPFIVSGTTGVGAIAGLSNGTFFDPGDHYAYLGAGQTKVMTYGYTIRDGGGLTDAAVVRLTVVGVNDGPAAAADAFALSEDAGAATLDVLANDSDVDADDVLTVSGLDLTGTRGVVSVAGDGLGVSYAPGGAFEALAEGEIATDSFAYTVSDGQGGEATEVVTITVTGVNDAPVALADAFAVTEDDGPAVLDVLANDSDVDAGAVLTVSSVDAAGVLGALSISADGTSLLYAPDGAFEALGLGETATETFTCTVSDGQGGSATQTVTVTVEGVNEVVVAEPGTRELEGSDYADDLYASAPHLTINGGAGDDRIYASGGGVIHGDEGDDLLVIGAGNDSVHGDAGDDTFILGEGNDNAYGGDGDDTFFVGAGKDRIEGGAGFDTVVFEGAFDSYEIQPLGKGKGADGALRIWSGGDHNTLGGIEAVVFADGTLDAATMTFQAFDALLTA